MKISLLCSDPLHPVNAYLEKWISANRRSHEVTLVRRKSDLPGGDILFLISCSEIVRANDRAAYRAVLVLHASDLPRGRGWSPHIWAIINGAETITLSLLEAADKVDCGKIWAKRSFPVPKHALWDEINASLFETELNLIDFAIENFETIRPSDQDPTIPSTYLDRRYPEDSRINPELSISEQFNFIRVCDPCRFPAFFDMYGHRYKLTLEKVDGKSDHN